MWFLFALLVTFLAFMIGGAVGEWVPLLMVCGLILGSLWQVIALLVDIRDALHANDQGRKGER